MKKLPCFVATTALAGLLVVDSATTSFATPAPTASPSATMPSGRSTTTDAAPTPPPRDFAYPSLKLDSYDPATHEATVSTFDGEPGDAFSVSHVASQGTPDAGPLDTRRDTLPESRNWSWTIENVYKGDLIKLSTYGAAPDETIPITTGPELPAPHVETRTHDGIVDVTYTHYRSGWATVEDADGHRVVQSPGQVKSADGGFVSTFVMPDTGRTSTFTVFALRTGGEKSKVDFIINEGKTDTTLPAPIVDTTTGDAKMVATIAGEVGATVTVKNSADAVVAVKKIGATGRTQLALPKPANRADTAPFTATQTAGGTTSPVTPFGMTQ